MCWPSAARCFKYTRAIEESFLYRRTRRVLPTGSLYQRPNLAERLFFLSFLLHPLQLISLFSSFPWQLPLLFPPPLIFPEAQCTTSFIQLNLIPLPLKAESHSNSAHTKPASWPQEPHPSVAATAHGPRPLKGKYSVLLLPLPSSYHFLERMVKHHLRRKITWELSV